MKVIWTNIKAGLQLLFHGRSTSSSQKSFSKHLVSTVLRQETPKPSLHRQIHTVSLSTSLLSYHIRSQIPPLSLLNTYFKMRFQLALLALPFLAMAYPQGSTDAPALPTAEPVPQPPSEPASLRSGVAGAGPITCALTGSDVRYRTCPSTDNKKCPAVGQYGPAGTKVAFKCFTYGESVYGNV